jgi:hypothetical protein
MAGGVKRTAQAVSNAQALEKTGGSGVAAGAILLTEPYELT